MRKRINCFAIWVVLLLLPLLGLADTLEVTFIDVGQGDAALIQCGGHAMLVDAGTNRGTNALLDFLEGRGIEVLDYVIGTHPHEDHIGGLDAVIATLEVKTIWMPYAQNGTRTFEDVLLAIQEKDLRVIVPEVGKSIALGDATLTVLGPINGTYSDLNNHSMVIRVDHGANSFLFTGDAEALSEREMLLAGTNLAATVLKVGHHGSSTSSTREFLHAVQPQYAVISCGADNTYGHPHGETLEKLQEVGAEILRTDESGSIVVISDRTTLSIQHKSNRLVEAEETVYIGNKNSKTLHLHNGHSLSAEHNGACFDAGMRP